MTFSYLGRLAFSSAAIATMATTAWSHDAAGIAHTHDFLLALGRLTTVAAVGLTTAAVLAGVGILIARLVANVKRTA